MNVHTKLTVTKVLLRIFELSELGNTKRHKRCNENNVFLLIEITEARLIYFSLKCNHGVGVGLLIIFCWSAAQP